MRLTPKKVSRSDDIDDSMIGGNASAEEATEASESAVQKGFNIALDMRLQEQPPMDKKAYMVHMKTYLKRLAAKMKENGKSEEDIATFKAQATEVVKRVAKNVGECEIFVGESDEAPEAGMAVIVDYREDGVTPFFMFWEAGLLEEKQ